jgi:hypothetical protein
MWEVFTDLTYTKITGRASQNVNELRTFLTCYLFSYDSMSQEDCSLQVCIHILYLLSDSSHVSVYRGSLILFDLIIIVLDFGGARWRSGYYATNRQVAGSIPDGVIGILQ